MVHFPVTRRVSLLQFRIWALIYTASSRIYIMTVNCISSAQNCSKRETQHYFASVTLKRHVAFGFGHFGLWKALVLKWIWLESFFSKQNNDLHIIFFEIVWFLCTKYSWQNTVCYFVEPNFWLHKVADRLFHWLYFKRQVWLFLIATHSLQNNVGCCALANLEKNKEQIHTAKLWEIWRQCAPLRMFPFVVSTRNPFRWFGGT